MCSKSQHLEVKCPYLRTKDLVKRQLSDRHYVWLNDAENCLILAFYCEQEAQAEAKIFKFLMHRAKNSESIGHNRNRTRVPTDAEIIFGDCDCEKLFCDRTGRRCSWDRSRIDWLWNLEQRQQLVRETRRPENRKSLRTIRAADQTGDSLKSSAKARQRIFGCWHWMFHSCGCVSDVESLDVPYSKSTSV